MKILENKVICIFLMLLLIVTGLFLGGYKSLNRLHSNAVEIFFVGEHKDGICVANDLSERAAAAANMLTISRRYPDFQKNEAAPDIAEQLSRAGADLNGTIAASSEGSIAAAFAANKVLAAAMTEMYHALGQLPLTEKDEKYRQKLYADFNSRNDTISHDPYNSYAQSYNSALTGFPASLIAAVMPIEPLPLAY